MFHFCFCLSGAVVYICSLTATDVERSLRKIQSSAMELVVKLYSDANVFLENSQSNSYLIEQTRYFENFESLDLDSVMLQKQKDRQRS